MVSIMRCKRKTIDDCIKDAETNFSFPIILIIILLIISIWTEYCYILLFFVLVILFYIVNQLKVRKLIKKIKKYLVDNDLIDKIGNVYFWNEKDYMVADNYFIILEDNKINIFKYEEIEKVYKKTFVRLSQVGSVEKYLYIYLKNGEEYKILISSTLVRSEEFMDISDFLISKNIEIIDEDD